ncbi:MAG TPA: glutaminyl-peptide cyclotransferase [Acidobacteria bacterium]|nr:glutaminyl-peptide cyclotransferase [Acidobacteriota bacterium]
MTRRRRVRRVSKRPRAAFISSPAALAAVALSAVLIWRVEPSPQAAQAESGAQPFVRSLRVDVLRELPHERDAYTQGLVWWNDRLFESAGLRQASTLRRLDPQTGQVQQRLDVAPEYWAEGLALVDDRLFQITYTRERAFTYDRDSFAPGETFSYDGEGWGLCYDGTRLVMSNGSDRLTFRDPTTFESIGEQSVRLRGQPLRNLNELECVDGAVYANVHGEEFLVRIDPATGRVTDYIDASGLLSDAERVGIDLFNGIACHPTAETFYITGKLWPKMFEVRFVE